MSSPASPQHNKTEHKALQAQTCLPSLACPASTRQGESPTDLLGTERHLFRTWWAAVLVYRIAPPSFRNPHRFVLCISPLSLCIPWNTYFLAEISLLCPLCFAKGHGTQRKQHEQQTDHEYRDTQHSTGGWCKDRLQTGVKLSLGAKHCMYIKCNYFTWTVSILLSFVSTLFQSFKNTANWEMS